MLGTITRKKDTEINTDDPTSLTHTIFFSLGITMLIINRLIAVEI